MSIYTQTETLGPLSYHYVNNDIDSKQKQLARDRMAKRDYNNPDNTMFDFDGKHYSLRAVK